MHIRHRQPGAIRIGESGLRCATLPGHGPAATIPSFEHRPIGPSIGIFPLREGDIRLGQTQRHSRNRASGRRRRARSKRHRPRGWRHSPASRRCPEIPDSIAVAVAKAARIDVIKDGPLPPSLRHDVNGCAILVSSSSLAFNLGPGNGWANALDEYVRRVCPLWRRIRPSRQPCLG